MAGQWRPGDTEPDRWLLALESGSASLEDACTALASYEWPDSTPALSGDTSDPFPEGGWIKTVEAAYGDGRVTAEQYEAIWLASSGRG